jgi:SAM-dependent methyltransferase
VNAQTTDKRPHKESLDLDVEALRRHLGPVKVALIERWIREVNGPYNAAIADQVTPESVVLDIGCSRGDPDLPALSEGRLLFGADVDLPGLRANRIARAVVHAPVTALPFADASVDVIAMKWVAEHLAEPEAAFRECARVLRPGGVVCVLTPNAWSIFTLLSRLIPYRLKQVLKGRMFGVHEEDTFRTYYRANTRRQLGRQCAAAGLGKVDLFLIPGMWTFFIFNRPLALLVRAVERVQQRVPLARGTATYIVGVWQKRKLD